MDFFKMLPSERARFDKGEGKEGSPSNTDGAGAASRWFGSPSPVAETTGIFDAKQKHGRLIQIRPTWTS